MPGNVLVVSNPRSLGVERTLTDVRAACAHNSAVEHRVTADQEAMRTLFLERRWDTVDMLVLHGGDGSVQCALTELANSVAISQWPMLAVLPAGTTNMTAHDLNDNRRFDRCLAGLRGYLSGMTRAIPAQRSLVSVLDSAGVERVGFFFGIGAIVDGIEYFQRRRHDTTSGKAGPGLAFVRGLWGLVRGEALFAGAPSVRLEHALQTANNATEEEMVYTHALRLGLVTTLTRLLLGLRPFWAPERTHLDVTWVEADARRFVLNLPRLLSGRPSLEMVPANGYHSLNLSSLRIQFSGAYTIDGEIYATRDGPMYLSQSPPVRVLAL